MKRGTRRASLSDVEFSTHMDRSPEMTEARDDRVGSKLSLEAIRAEEKIAASSELRALLALEAGVREQSQGNEPRAIRDYLDAINAAAKFRAPLERLILLMERRRSFKNLARLLERQSKVANTPEQRAHAELMKALFALVHTGDPEAAKTAALAATQAAPKDVAPWLILQLVAGRLGDLELQRQALTQRSELCEHPAYRALLLTELAEHQLEAGDASVAGQTLEQAFEIRAAQLPLSLYLSQERIARRLGATELTSRLLVRQSELMLDAANVHVRVSVLPPASQPAIRSALVAPTRSVGHAAECLLRAALLVEPGQARELLTQAETLAPGDPLIAATLLNHAIQTRDTESIIDQGRRLLAAEPSAAVSAALLTRIGEALLRSGDTAAALRAWTEALDADSNCLVAWALLLDSDRHAALGSSVTQYARLAELFEGDAKIETLLLGAFLHAVQGHASELQNHIDAARAVGLPAQFANLIALGLHRLSSNTAATNGAQSSTIGLALDPSLSSWTERWLSNSAPVQMELDDLSAEERSIVATALAYSPLLRPPSTIHESRQALDASVTALNQLADHADAEALTQAFRTAAALRQLRSILHPLGEREELPAKAYDSDDGASLGETLQSLHELALQQPQELTLKSVLAQTALKAGQPKTVVAAWSDIADRCEDARLSVALRLAAFRQGWQADLHDTALEQLERVVDQLPNLTELQGWALRFARPNDADTRRRVLERWSHAPGGLAELERFALEACSGDDTTAVGEANAALDSIDDEASADIVTAAQLGRAIFNGGADDLREDALLRLGGVSEQAATLSHAARYYLMLTRSPDAPPGELAELARQWATHDRNPVSLLEWAAAAERAEDWDSRHQAQAALADHLEAHVAHPLRLQQQLRGNLKEHTNDGLIPAAATGLTSTEPAFASVQLMNLELTRPGHAPAHRAAGLSDSLSQHDDDSAYAAQLMTAYNLIWAGLFEPAERALRNLLGAFPQDQAVWDAMLALGEESDDPKLQVEAYAALARLASDDRQAADYLEHSAALLIDRLADEEGGKQALEKAVERDIQRFSSFDRLFRLVRERHESAGLLDLISKRLEVTQDADELTRLFWERARALRELGDTEGALEALANVEVLDSAHVGALALLGEIHISKGEFVEAAETLAKLAHTPAAPKKQRLVSGVAASDLFELRLEQPKRALEILRSLVDAKLSDLSIHERMARNAAKVEAWEDAVVSLQVLMAERDSAEGRSEAGRLALAIYRDKLERLTDAESAVDTVLENDPADAEALDCALTHDFGEQATSVWLKGAREKLLKDLRVDPLAPERVTLLARIVERAADPNWEQLVFGLAVGLGESTEAMYRRLKELDAAQLRIPETRFDASALELLRDPNDGGPIAELMALLAPTYAEALGPDLDALGIAKRHRVKPNAVSPARNELSAWLGAFGLGEFELYVGGNDPHGVFAVPGAKPAFVLGHEIKTPFNAVLRTQVAREVYCLGRGTTLLRHREPGDIAALVSATAAVVGQPMSGPSYAISEEFERQVAKRIPRKLKKLAAPVIERIVESEQDPAVYAEAATNSANRFAALIIGDVSWVLALAGHTPRGQLSSRQEFTRQARDLLRFCLSPQFFELRRLLGVAPK